MERTKVEAYVATNKRKNSRGEANLVEVASEEPLSVDGTELDPDPAGSELGVPGVLSGDPDGEAALHLLVGGVLTLQALGSSSA